MKKHAPTTDKLKAKVIKDWNSLKKGSRKKQINTSARAYVEETARETARVTKAMSEWMQNGFGKIDAKKREGIFRLIWENFNSLCILTDERNLSKVRGLDILRKSLDADMVAGCEAQTNWYKVPQELRFDRLVGLGEDQRHIAAHNINDKTRCQPGGTLIAAYGRAIGFGNVEVGKDETGLARWVFMKFTTEGTVRRFVSAYRLKMPSTLKRRGLDWAGTTVYEQHFRYYKAHGYLNKDPIYNFDKDLRLASLVCGYSNEKKLC